MLAPPLILTLTLFVGVTFAAVTYKDEMSDHVFYRTHQRGRLFFLGFPYSAFSFYEKVLQMTFMTGGEAATVTLLIPKESSSELPAYHVSSFDVTHHKPVVKAVHKSFRVDKCWSFWSIRISSTKDITIQVNYYLNNADTFILPPTSSYARHYTLYSPPIKSVIVTIALYQNTRVTFNLPHQKGWTTTKDCGHDTNFEYGQGPSTFYISGSTFHVLIVEQGKLPKMSLEGTTIDADKPVLILLCGEALSDKQFSISPVPPNQMWSKNYAIPVYLEHMSIAVIGMQQICKLHPIGQVDVQTRIPNRTLCTGKIPFVPLTKPVELRCVYPVGVTVFSDDRFVLSIFQFSLIPNDRWPSFVQFAKRKFERPLKMVLLIYTYKHMIGDLLYNGENITQYTWRPLMNRDLCYTVANVTDYVTLKTGSAYNSFVAYVIGKSPRSPVIGMGLPLGGWYTFPSNQSIKNCKPYPMEPGDNVDNDCDGKFDEEELDGKDNDRDGKTDEDLNIQTADGKWGPWSPFRCTAQCRGVGTNARSRKCDSPPPSRLGNPCQGNFSEAFGMCKRDDSEYCRKACKPGFYGPSCVTVCSKHCLNKMCDKKTGKCFTCKDGSLPSPVCLSNENAAVADRKIDNWTFTSASERMYDVLVDFASQGSPWIKMLIPLSFTVLVLVLIFTLEICGRCLTCGSHTDPLTDFGGREAGNSVDKH